MGSTKPIKGISMALIQTTPGSESTAIMGPDIAWGEEDTAHGLIPGGSTVIYKFKFLYYKMPCPRCGEH